MGELPFDVLRHILATFDAGSASDSTRRRCDTIRSFCQTHKSACDKVYRDPDRNDHARVLRIPLIKCLLRDIQEKYQTLRRLHEMYNNFNISIQETDRVGVTVCMEKDFAQVYFVFRRLSPLVRFHGTLYTEAVNIINMIAKLFGVSVLNIKEVTDEEVNGINSTTYIVHSTFEEWINDKSFQSCPILKENDMYAKFELTTEIDESTFSEWNPNEFFSTLARHSSRVLKVHSAARNPFKNEFL